MRAVIYVPDDPCRWTARCLHHCTTRGYTVVATIYTPGAQGWEDARTLVTTGRADVIVVGSHAHVPADRPLVEEAVDSGDGSASSRRPRLV